MAVAQTYLLTSAVFGTGPGITITSLTTGSISENVQETNLTADSSRAVNLVVTDLLSVDITVESMDTSQANNFDVGDTGQLVLKGKLRTAGDGLSDEVTITCKSVCVVGVNDNIETQGESGIAINFRAYDEAATHETEVSNIIEYT